MEKAATYHAHDQVQQEEPGFIIPRNQWPAMQGHIRDIVYDDDIGALEEVDEEEEEEEEEEDDEDEVDEDMPCKPGSEVLDIGKKALTSRGTGKKGLTSRPLYHHELEMYI